MKRIALVFILAILVPALLLAGLAMRSMRDQEMVVNAQRVELHQATCDDLATDINLFMDDVREFYSQLVDEMVREHSADLIDTFNDRVTQAWSQAAVGAVVSERGKIRIPRESGSVEEQLFLENNSDLLTKDRVVEVYQAPQRLRRQVQIEKKEVGPDQSSSGPVRQKVEATIDKLGSLRFESRDRTVPEVAAAPVAVAEAEAEATAPVTRSVSPSNGFFPADREAAQVGVSNLYRESLNLDDLTTAESEGAVSRIIDGGLHILLWKKHPAIPGYTFWTELDLDEIQKDVASLLTLTNPREAAPEVALALLNGKAEPVSRTLSEFETDWSTPFVAAEVGQILPRWEVAAYLLDPAALDRSANTARFTLLLTTLLLLGAVAVGAILILRSVNYEMRLATQKTDFVSNVSHELKTPLTSIRMFSELLSSPEAVEEGKAQQYSRVIQSESERLSRLINRLLDFAKLDQDTMNLRSEEIDLTTLLAETASSHSSDDLELKTSLPDRPVSVRGDRDAILQVLLNLLGNAEKYASDGGEITIELRRPEDETAVFAVHDRGPGIPRSHQKRIFEKFYRCDDSIDSGIEGSGIGLSLSQQLINRLGGEIRYEDREGGGSSFLMTLPTTSTV